MFDASRRIISFNWVGHLGSLEENSMPPSHQNLPHFARTESKSNNKFLYWHYERWSIFDRGFLVFGLILDSSVVLWAEIRLLGMYRYIATNSMYHSYDIIPILNWQGNLLSNGYFYIFWFLPIPNWQGTFILMVTAIALHYTQMASMNFTSL